MTTSETIQNYKQKIKNLLDRGLNQNEIALKLGISRQLLQYNLKKMNLTKKQREQKKENDPYKKKLKEILNEL